MKVLYIILVLIVAYGVFVYVRFKHTLSGAHLVEITQHDQTFGQGPTIKYIAAGDSLSVGEGATTVEQSYPYKIAQALSSANTVQYRNVAVNGARTTDVINEQVSKIIDYNPDIITLSIGGNDVTHLQKNDVVVANIKNILETLTQKTHAQIYVADIPIVDRVPLFPYFYQAVMHYKVNKINPQILSLGSERVHIIDIHEFGWDSYPDIRKTFAKDGFHPNDEGYTNWIEAFLSKIKNP